MTDLAAINKLVDDIRRIGGTATSDPEGAVERHVQMELARLPLEERVNLLEAVAERLGTPSPTPPSPPPSVAGPENEDITRLISLFLGKDVHTGDVNSREISENFAASLNTLFDSLNRIVSVMNTTLTGQRPELEETIRMVIGTSMKADGVNTSIQEYLERIQSSFLVAHTSFQQAARKILKEILTEFDPEKLGAEKGSGFRIGPLHKANQFDAFMEKYLRLKIWVDTGAFNEKLLREFEKSCQQALAKQKR